MWLESREFFFGKGGGDMKREAGKYLAGRKGSMWRRVGGVQVQQVEEEEGGRDGGGREGGGAQAAEWEE